MGERGEVAGARRRVPEELSEGQGKDIDQGHLRARYELLRGLLEPLEPRGEA